MAGSQPDLGPESEPALRGSDGEIRSTLSDRLCGRTLCSGEGFRRLLGSEAGAVRDVQEVSLRDRRERD